MNEIDKIIYEHTKRIEWFIGGIGIHCLSPELFNNLSTERLCELYNVDLNHFKK
jgi:hypothetical protein